MVRGTGLEPVSSRWQRNILAARRSQHIPEKRSGAKCEARRQCLAAPSQEMNAERFSHKYGADGESRTRVIGLEAQGTSRYTTPA
jgi:hypothetical protein